MINAFSTAADLVLDLDPDLGSGVGAEDWEMARQACIGQLVRVARGRFDSAAAFDSGLDVVGLVIVEGLLCREVALHDRFMAELLGPMDVLQLPSETGRPRLSQGITVTAATETVLLVLADSFVRAAARWPSLLATLLRRVEVQRERLAVQGLIALVPRAEHRLLLMLWHLADRWGSATAEGTVLSLALTHELLGQLIGGSRPTATIAIGALQADGSIRRLEDGSWLLTAAARSRVTAIVQSRGPARVLGETLALRQLTREAAQASRALRAEARQIRARNRAIDRAHPID
jgi:CRP/FNR family transcriptional regulator, cyclic AMP receptor protein